jgi:tripartite-type tricarboxylate transporter receptor subunit TctC
MKVNSGFLAASLAAWLCAPAGAQDYPNKPVRLVVGFPTGGNVDVFARIVAQKMSEGLGRPMLVENRTGAGSMIANDHVAKSSADGYTLLLISGAFVTQAATQKKMPYDPVRDFSWVSTLVSYPLVFAVRPDSRFRTLDDLLAEARSGPGALNYPSPGIGTLYHLAAEMFGSMAGIKMTHVPFRGGSEPQTEVLAGRMDVLIDALTVVYPQIQAGKFRPLAVSSFSPSPSLPGTPTVAQSVPGYEADSFLGIAGPAGMTPAVLERLNQEVRRILTLPDIGQRFAEWGGAPGASTPEQMRSRVESEIGKWKRVVEAGKIEIQ